MNTNRHPPIGLKFTEEMQGYLTDQQTLFENGYRLGKSADKQFKVHLTIRTNDLDRFLESPSHQAQAIGYVESSLMGGRRPVLQGTFNLLVDTSDRSRKEMRYRLMFEDAQGKPFTLSGFKNIQSAFGPHVWRDTTTLFTNLYQGHLRAEEESGATIFATGILRITPGGFLRQLTTFHVDAPTFFTRVASLTRFGGLFLHALWECYRPNLHTKMGKFEREIPLYTTQGVHDAGVTVHPFSTGDGLGISLLRFQRVSTDDVVLILHGLTLSSDMFIMPEHNNLVQYLLDHGYGDVWSLDFRMSNRYAYNLQRNRFNLDDIALFDHPEAVATVRRAIGEGKRIHVICHCLGSLSFMMSLAAQKVTGIRSAISNSVALTPSIPPWSRMKLTVGPWICQNILGIEYLNPGWRREPGWSIGKVMGWLASLFHTECDSPECHMLCFMWGSGSPALYKHENMADQTHRRSGDLFGGVSMNYYRHVLKMVKAKHSAVKFAPDDPQYNTLPDNYLEKANEIKTPILFITGQQNRVFSDSNIECYQHMNKAAPGLHELHVFPNYGHQDVFMGKHADRDVFPRLLAHLRKHSH